MPAERVTNANWGDDMALVTIDGMPVHTDNKLRIGKRIHGSGTITKTFDGKAPRQEMCAGCRDDFYNGHNDLGVKQCGMFKSAKVVNKVGYSSIHCVNGPDTILQETLSCWHGVSK